MADVGRIQTCESDETRLVTPNLAASLQMSPPEEAVWSVFPDMEFIDGEPAMKTLSLIAGVLLLGLGTAASAEPVVLTSVQLDAVAAGAGGESNNGGMTWSRKHKSSSGGGINILSNFLNNNNVSVLSGNQILSGIGILGTGTAGNLFGLTQ